MKRGFVIESGSNPVIEASGPYRSPIAALRAWDRHRAEMPGIPIRVRRGAL